MKDYIDLVVLYSDLVGSTKAVAKLNPTQVRSYYSLFLTEMTHVVADFGGRVLKYSGDCIIGFFPVFKNFINQIENAVACAKMIPELMVKVVDPAAKKKGLPSMSCRIGMDFGRAEILAIGVKGIHYQIDLWGHVMNVAAKICSNADANEVLIGDSLWKKLHAGLRVNCKLKERLDLDGGIYPIYTLP